MSTQLPVEDISAVVSRFQAWAGTQVSPPAREGVRELTYEEAIQSMRDRAGYSATPSKAEPAAPSAEAGHGDGREELAAKKKIPAGQNAGNTHRQSFSPPMAVIEPPSFQQILSGNVSILPAASSQETTAIQRRSAAVSVRVSSAEIALLKQRAAEANLSLSGYVRNCVFEIESLRIQLASTLAAQKPVREEPHEIFPVATCVRFARRLFSRKISAFAIRV